MPPSSPSSPIPQLPNYKLGEKLGQGAFGTVYKAVNWTNGETIALKQIGLGKIAKSDLPDIMSEIDLLKSLVHPNIVQYRGFIKTTEFLYIILEYCENGSLLTMLKKYGRFPESLASLYTFQVLQGLSYLHEQGVIHRDIKAGNILATKEGGIKLADFGVATRAGGPSSSSIVGSPYWMSPESISQTPLTTSSDIWSLGALVLELLTGSPPYASLDPLPALWRIVNDETVPIPAGTSEKVRDFLGMCFVKEGSMRVGAGRLLKHSWVAGVGKREVVERGYEGTVRRVLEWNKALNSSTVPIVQPLLPTLSRLKPVKPSIKTKPLLSLAANLLPQPARYVEEVGDVWDEDFEEGISLGRITAALDAPPVTSSDDEYDENTSTIRPSPRPSPTPSPTPPIDDYSDLAADDTNFENRVASLRRHNSARKRILHPKDLSESYDKKGSVRMLGKVEEEREVLATYPGGDRKAATLAAYVAPPSARITTTATRLPSRFAADNGRTTRPPPPTSAPLTISTTTTMKTSPDLSQFVEPDSESYDDVFGDSPSLLLQSRLSTQSTSNDQDTESTSPFSLSPVSPTFSDSWNSSDLAASVAREALSRLIEDFKTLLERLGGPEEDLCEVAKDLMEGMERTPSLKDTFVRNHGMLLLIEVLQRSRERGVVKGCLMVVNIVVESDSETLEKICLVGGCPIILGFASPRYSDEIRHEAALFIGSMCRTSVLTLQIFISCRGLKTLVEMMDESYVGRRELVWLAVEGVSRVFELHGPTPRNDFCRIFAQEGILSPLSFVLLSLCTDKDAEAVDVKRQLLNLLVIFSQSDRKVKEGMTTRSILLRLVKAVPISHPACLAPLLKTLKNLTMLPTSLDALQSAGVIESLVSVLSSPSPDLSTPEIQNHTLQALFSLSRLSLPRQLIIANSGAVPSLMRVGMSASPLREFALKILCDFSKGEEEVRDILWRHGGLGFYISLLKDPSWANPALESILSWLQESTSLVEPELLRSESMDCLLRLFCTSRTSVFENLLEAFTKILRTSPSIASLISLHPPFFTRLSSRLSPTPSPLVTLNLLRLLKTIFESPSPPSLLSIRPLGDLVRGLESSDAVLVRGLARECRGLWEGKKGKRILRRTISEPVPAHSTPTPEGPRGSGGKRGGEMFGRT